MKILLTILNLILAGIGVDMFRGPGFWGFHLFLLLGICFFFVIPLFSIFYAIRKRPSKVYAIVLLILNLILLAVGVFYSVRGVLSADWGNYLKFLILIVYLTSILNITYITKNLKIKS